MIQFVLSLASVPQILVYALLLAIVIGTAFRAAFRHPLSSMVVGWYERPEFRNVVEADVGELQPGTVISLGNRFTFPLRMLLLRLRLAVRAVGLSGVVLVVALLAAIGLHVLVGTATALLTPRPVAQQSLGIERGA